MADDMTDDDMTDDEGLGTAAETTPGDEATSAEGEDAATVLAGGGDLGGVPGRDDLEGDIGADVTGATGPLSRDAGFDEDVPGASPEPDEPRPGHDRGDLRETGEELG